MLDFGGSNCKICSKNNSSFYCHDCIDHQSLCESCFKFLHSSSIKKTHRNEKLDKEKVSKSLIEINSLSPCKTHIDEKLKFVCINCQEIICPECSIKGVHEGHKLHKCDEVLKIVSEYKFPEKEIFEQISAKAKKLYDLLDTKSKTIIQDINNCKKQVLKGFSLLEGALYNKKKEIISMIEDCEFRKRKYFEKIECSVIKTIQDMDRIYSISEKLKRKEITNITTSLYQDVISINEITNDKKVNDMIKLENSIMDIGSVQKLDLNFADALKQIECISIKPKDNLAIEIVVKQEKILINSNSNIYRIEGKVGDKKFLIKDEIEKRNLELSTYDFINFQELFIYIDSPWNYCIRRDFKDTLQSFTKISNFKMKEEWNIIVAEYSTCFKDSSSGHYFFGFQYDNLKVLEEYKSLDELFQRKKIKDIILEEGFDGLYAVAWKGALFHNISNSNYIAKSSLSDGKLIEKLQIPLAGYRNMSEFSWGGFSDIALFFDDSSQKLYVMYQYKEEEHTRITQIGYENQLTLEKTFILHNINKKTISFAVILGGSLFLGIEGKKPEFKIQIELENFKINREVSISIPGCGNIPHIFYDSESNTIITNEYGSISRYFP